MRLPGTASQLQTRIPMKAQTASALDSGQVAFRLGLCAAALAGTAGTVSEAQAAVITFSTPIAVPNTFDGVYINLLTGATGTSGGTVAGWDFNPYNSGTALSFFWSGTPANSNGGVAGATTGPYLDLAGGTTISAASTFSAVTAAAQTLAFQAPGTHTLGFRFFNEGTGAVNYGYLSLTSAGANGFPLTINGWSFENTGAAISVVPETSTTLMMSMGALALGALNLRRLRRQRRGLAA